MDNVFTPFFTALGVRTKRLYVEGDGPQEGLVPTLHRLAVGDPNVRIDGVRQWGYEEKGLHPKLGVMYA